ncbi:hypothetical protein U1Q18_001520 [Sarracenia purpurea var. burkii]
MKSTLEGDPLHARKETGFHKWYPRRSTKFVVAAIHDIVYLDQGGGAVDPSVGGVNEAGKSEGLFGLVEVADGD